MDARELSNIISEMKNRQDAPAAVLNLYDQYAGQLNAIHLANIYGVLAKSVRGAADVNRLKTDSRFKGLLKMTNEKLQRTPQWFGVRAIATITHSLGKLKIFDERFFTQIVKLSDSIATVGDSQDISNIVWSCATVGWKSVELFQAVAAEHRRIAKTGDVQDLCTICWAFAKLGCNSDALFRSVAGQQKRIVRIINLQDVANTLWSFAAAGKLEEGRGLVEKLWKKACDGQLQLNDESLKQVSGSGYRRLHPLLA